MPRLRRASRPAAVARRGGGFGAHGGRRAVERDISPSRRESARLTQLELRGHVERLDAVVNDVLADLDDGARARVVADMPDHPDGVRAPDQLRPQ